MPSIFLAITRTIEVIFRILRKCCSQFFIFGIILFFFCFNFISIHYHTQKQKKIWSTLSEELALECEPIRNGEIFWMNSETGSSE